jgi:hypothetical protein
VLNRRAKAQRSRPRQAAPKRVLPEAQFLDRVDLGSIDVQTLANRPLAWIQKLQARSFRRTRRLSIAPFQRPNSLGGILLSLTSPINSVNKRPSRWVLIPASCQSCRSSINSFTQIPRCNSRQTSSVRRAPTHRASTTRVPSACFSVGQLPPTKCESCPRTSRHCKLKVFDHRYPECPLRQLRIIRRQQFQFARK